MAEIAALIDTGEPRLDIISERGLRTSYHRKWRGVAASGDRALAPCTTRHRELLGQHLVFT